MNRWKKAYEELHKKYDELERDMTLVKRHNEDLRIYHERHAVWIQNIIRYNHNLEKVYISYECSHCTNRRKVDIFESSVWDEYMQYHYNPELPKYCEGCGCRMFKKEVTECNERCPTED